MPFDLFISYSRKDNVPRLPGDQRGWVTALHDEILADHRRFSTEPLRFFFDPSEIGDMDDWRHRILTGLRESRILLVCLSPDYFKSPPCLWEWEEYLKRQVHAFMGQESVAPVYFVEASGSDEQLNAAWAEAVTRKAVTPADRSAWELRWKAWREATLDRPNWVDLKPWFPHGVEALRETAVREKLAALGTSLWERIQRARRATGVPGNLRRINPHFIGRRSELRQLHENLALGAFGIVTAVHGLGGQGKTELATAYAHGWADCYPAGLWVLGAEGKKEILPLLGELCAELEIPLTTGPDETADARGRRVLAELKRRAAEAALRDSDKGAACLVILDNVSDPALLAEPQLAHIPREDWLRVVVTTREGPENFPASRRKSLAFIAVDALTEDDAARLIEDHQPDAQWPAATAAVDAVAAREIARELAGFTLAVESVAIYLGLHPDIRPAAYLARLRAEGLTGVDSLPGDADVAAQMQHREKQLRLVLDQTLTRLTPPERTVLDYAALLPPDCIPWPWLRALVMEEHPDEFATRPGYPDPWPALRRRLEGLRLVTPGDHLEIGRLHRMVAAFVSLQNMEQERFLLRLTRHAKSRACFLRDCWGKIPNLWEADAIQKLLAAIEPKAPAQYFEILMLLWEPMEMLGQFDDIESQLNVAKQIAKALYGHQSLEYASVLFAIGSINHALSRNVSHEYYTEALAIQEQVAGVNHLDVAKTLNLMSMLTSNDEKRTLDILVDPVLASSASESASDVGIRRGKRQEQLSRRALQICDANGLTDDPLKAYVLANLADHLACQMRGEEAEQMAREALEITERVFAKPHPEIALRLANLAGAFAVNGKLDEALLAQRAARSMTEEVYGVNHYHVCSSLGAEWNILKVMGRHEEALETLKSKIRVGRLALSPDNPVFVHTLIGVATGLVGGAAPGLISKKRHREALPIFEEAILLLLSSQTPGMDSIRALQPRLLWSYCDSLRRASRNKTSASEKIANLSSKLGANGQSLIIAWDEYQSERKVFRQRRASCTLGCGMLLIVLGLLLWGLKNLF